ncbi:unnamed protein product, partial [Candidula unifasciata]
DEVLALEDRLVVRLDDLVPLIRHDVQWTYGRCADHVLDGCQRTKKAHEANRHCQIVKHENGKKRNFGVDISERGNMDSVCDSACSGAANVLVLTYPKYCRYRAMQKRLEGAENHWAHLAVVAAIGGLSGNGSGCRIMFCRETFSQVEYEELSMRMDHMLPVFKNNTRGKKCRHTGQKDSQHDSDSMEENYSFTSCPLPTSSRPRRSVESLDVNDEKVSTEEQAFLIGLHKFMHEAQMPIGRIPSLGFKQIDLYFFYKQAERLGGYDMITEKRMWKRLYDQLGGNSSNTSAATCTRKHYERLLLPYERHLIKQKTNKTKKKVKKTMSIEADVKQEAVVKLEAGVRNKAVKQEHGSPHMEEVAENGDVVIAIPEVTVFSKPDLEEKQESSEIAAVEDEANCQDHTETVNAGDSSSGQHLTVAETEPVQQHLPTSTADVTVVPTEKPNPPYTSEMCSLLPVQPSCVLHTAWPVLTPEVLPAAISSSWNHSGADVILAVPKDSVKASVQESMLSLGKNQKPLPVSLSSLGSSCKASSSPAVVGQTYQPSSPTGRRAHKLANRDTEYQITSVPVSQVRPANHLLLSSQHLNQNPSSSSQNLASSSQNLASPSQNLASPSHRLASLLHPTPAGHQHRQHLPPAPSSVYLHPSATNQLSLLQAPTFPAPAAHCHVRKRAYPFETCTTAATAAGTFPSPDMVLDRIRHCTSFPISSPVLAKPSGRQQRFDDPRDIFRQIPPQAAAASQIPSQSLRKETRLPPAKQSSNKPSNSGSKHSQQQLLQSDNSLSSCDSKVTHSTKATSHSNGFISSPRSSKSVASVSLCQSPAGANNGRLTSALFGSQFTALPRIAKPSDFSCQSTSLLEPSLPAAATAMTLNAHLHPAFVSPFLQTTPAAAAAPSSPGLHLLAGAYTTPAQISAYEEMLRQNGYGRFLTASTQRKGFKKK